MMRDFKISILCGVFSFLSIQFFAQETPDYDETNGRDISERDNLNYIPTAVPFLTIAPDSRAASMGDVGVATSPDINSMHWNPSKYAFIDGQYGLCLSYTPWLRRLGIDDINLYYLVGYYRFDKKNVISGSLLYFSLGEIQFTTNTGDPIRIGEPNEFTLDVAYSRLFADKVSGSVAFRWIHSDLSNDIPANDVETSAGNAFAVDVSTFYQSKVKLGAYRGKMAYGLNISNVGSKISYTETDEYFIPINMRLGGTVTIDLDDYNSLAFSLDFNKLLVPTPPYEIDTIDQDSNTITIKYGKGDIDASVPVGMFRSFSDAPGYVSTLPVEQFSIYPSPGCMACNVPCHCP